MNWNKICCLGLWCWCWYFLVSGLHIKVVRCLDFIFWRFEVISSAMVSWSLLGGSHLILFLVSALGKVLCLVSLNQMQTSTQWPLCLGYEDNGGRVKWLPLKQCRETSLVVPFGFMNIDSSIVFLAFRSSFCIIFGARKLHGYMLDIIWFMIMANKTIAWDMLFFVTKNHNNLDQNLNQYISLKGYVLCMGLATFEQGNHKGQGWLLFGSHRSGISHWLFW